LAQFEGEKVDWLHTHGDLYVAAELNNTDDDAVSANKNKAQPRLYRNIRGQSFQNAVVVDNGSVVQFKIRSRGQFGFGYRIYAGLKDTGRRDENQKRIYTRDVIANRLYCLGSDEQVPKDDIDRAYQDADATIKPLIQIRSFPSIEAIAPTDRELQLGMMSCTVVSWGVYGYIDENSEDFGIPLNIGETPYTNLPELRSPRWDQKVNAQHTLQTVAFGGGPARLPASRGKASQAFSSADMIREDNPRFAPNYVSFAFLVTA
jgi:hypothetical protein